MDKLSPVQITQVRNGFLLHEPSSFTREGPRSVDDQYVFQTFAELLAFLNEHFTHRALSVINDSE